MRFYHNRAFGKDQIGFMIWLGLVNLVMVAQDGVIRRDTYVAEITLKY